MSLGLPHARPDTDERIGSNLQHHHALRGRPAVRQLQWQNVHLQPGSWPVGGEGQIAKPVLPDNLRKAGGIQGRDKASGPMHVLPCVVSQ